MNKDENHNGFQYQTGLNIDTESFNPSGYCTSGGLYFVKEDVLAFLPKGKWIRTVTLPPDAKVYENPVCSENGENPTIPGGGGGSFGGGGRTSNAKKFKADKIILGEKTEISGDTAERLVRYLVSDGANPKVGNSSILKWAAAEGYTGCVDFLIPITDPKDDQSVALKYAVMGENTEVVKLLVDVCDVKTTDNFPLKYAAEHGFTDIVKVLQPHADATAEDSYALRMAARNGYTEIVEFLLPVSNPRALNNYALTWATKNKHTEIVELLIPYLRW